MDFFLVCAKPAAVHYQPVVDRFPIPVPLDPIAAMLFALVLVVVAIATARRASYGLAALLFVQPFSWYHYVFSTTITFPKVVLIGVIAGLIRYPGIGLLLREKRLQTLALPLAALVAATAASGLHAHDRIAVLREVLKAIGYLALATAAYFAYRLDRNDRLLRGAFAISATIVAFSALLDELIGAPSGLWMHGHPVPRIAGLLEGPNQLAGYCEIATATLAAWSLSARTKLTDIALGFIGCILVLTFSRGGIAGNAVVIATLVCLQGRAALRALIPFAVGVAFGVAGAGIWSTLVQSNNLFRVTATQSAYAGGVGNRSELWKAALYLFRLHPLTGVGAGNYELDLPQAGVYGVRTHANSWYLQSLAEGGIVLFAAVAAFVAIALRTLWMGLRNNAWTCAAFAATLALALHQLADYMIFYPKVGGPWILLIALGMAALPARE
ncbi:MAG: O-antigen ligase family protein [Candidatus Eremiobacteraeota bacterium]|nr:O-antigen ligase family protein [Candidatus Eremiobacteraeota bacterium]